MARIYKDTPDNFSDIRPYVVTDPRTAGQEIILAEKCFFYDTCTFRWHMELPTPQHLFEYIKTKRGIVVVTRSIIMELCSANGKLWKKHIEFFRQLHQMGICVLVIYEEDLFRTLAIYTSGTERINGFLEKAVKYTRSRTGVISQTLEQDTMLRNRLLNGKPCADKTLFSDFFSKVRANKTTGDNLGEELVLVCLHMLANIPESGECKYIFLTDDKKAVYFTDEVNENIKRYIGKSCAIAFTTPRLVQQMWDEGVITRKETLEEMLLAGGSEGTIRVYCSKEYELGIVDESISVESLAEHIATGKGFRVFI